MSVTDKREELMEYLQKLQIPKQQANKGRRRNKKAGPESLPEYNYLF